MARQGSTLELLALTIGRAFSILEERLASDQTLKFFASLGVGFPSELLNQTSFTDATKLCTSSASALAPTILELSTAIDDDDVVQILTVGPRLIGQIRAVINALDEVARQLALAANSLTGITPDIVLDFAQTFAARVFDLLLIEHFEFLAPNPMNLLALIGIVEHSIQPGDPSDRTKPAFISKRLRLSRFVDAFRSPAQHIETLYGWGNSSFDGQLLLAQLQSYLRNLGLEPELRAASPGTPLTLASRLFEVRHNPTSTPPGLDVVTFVSLLDGLDIALPLVFPRWRVELAVRGRFESGLELSIVPLGQITLTPLVPPLEGHVLTKIVGEALIPLEPFVFLGQTGASRLEASSLKFTFGLTAVAGQLLGQSQGDLVVQAEIIGAKAIISTTGGDGFLTELTSSQNLRSEFDLRCSWSLEGGLTFEGSSGLEITITQHVSVGPIEIQQIHLASKATEHKVIPLEISAGLRTRLGPLDITIDRIGFEAVLSFPETGGNLGPVDLKIAFKSPSGLGLVIDGGGFKGGGFLRFIEAEKRYEGALELEYQDKIALKALALLTTKMPDGSTGFSLLIIISAEFTPVQLGLGFTLNGVGGLLGLNRTANVDRLRTGLRDATLNSVLFPQNVVANADRILSDLTQVFPPKSGRFLFGPMARIGWGTPTLLTIDLGLLIEIPDPIRVLILGVVRAKLPDENFKLLQLQVNFMGEIDFEAQRFSFDASLFDSKLLAFTLSGDMAVRICWGAAPNFLLTVGGFHPSYEPPPLNLPTLRRLTLQLTDSDNPRLTLEAYFAITSNTVQFGAKIELLAKAGSFSVYGFLSFDVLFQFNPFYFVAAISAKLALRAGSSEIASISVNFALEGPTPWHVNGTAKLKICWFLTIKVRFDKTFGERRNTQLGGVSVLPLLKTALADQGNWEAQLPQGRHLLTTFKEIQKAADDILVYPFGVLTIQQKLVPLNIDIRRFGSQQPTDGNRFAIQQVFAGEGTESEALATGAVREMFAPAQFFELSDTEKLARKSFEKYDSGVTLIDSAVFDADYVVRREVAYELFYVDDQRNLVAQTEPHIPDFTAFDHWTTRGSIANSPLSFAKNGKSTLAPQAVTLNQEQFVVVNARDLQPVSVDSITASEADARNLMDAMIRTNPALNGEIFVVPSFEVNTL